MPYSNFIRKRTIPNLSSRKTQPMTVDFSKGVNTYKPNDDMAENEIRLAENARFDKIGEYGTRKGLSLLQGKPVGYTKNFGTFSEDFNMVEASQARDVGLTIGKDTYIYSVKIKIQRANDRYVVPQLTLRSDHGGKIVSTSCVELSKDKDVHTYEFIFQDAPLFKGDERLVTSLDVQSGGIDDILVSTNGSGTMEIELYTADPGEVTNVFEAIVDGNKEIVFTFNSHLPDGSIRTELNHINSSDPNQHSHWVRTLPAGTTKVRFMQLMDTVYYVDGLEAPHKLTLRADGETDAAIPVVDLMTDTPLELKTNNILAGQEDNIIYGVTDPNTELTWTYPYGFTFAKSPSFSTTTELPVEIGAVGSVMIADVDPKSGFKKGDWIIGKNTAVAEITNVLADKLETKTVNTVPFSISSYDKFNVDFYQNFPAIKTGDPITALFSMGGVTYVMTRNHKYQMFSQTADSWTQAPCNAQKGTFSQESLVSDINYTYFASDDGVYMFDGSSEISLTEKAVQDVYDNIANKEGIVLDIHDNRLFVFFAKDSDKNNHCLVYNLNLRVWESIDSNVWVASTCARKCRSGRFLVGSSNWGLIMTNEDANYADLGQPIAFNLETAYQHFGATSQLKRITKWRPDFASTPEAWTVECGYAHDYSEDVRYAFSIDLKGKEFIDTGYKWDNPVQYGNPTSPTVHTTIPRVNGEFYRTQIRYQHIASYEPVIMRSHTLTVQAQRIR